LTAYGAIERLQSHRGDAAVAFDNAAVKLDEIRYSAETHNALELHSTVALWDGSMLTLYDSTHEFLNTQFGNKNP